MWREGEGKRRGGGNPLILSRCPAARRRSARFHKLQDSQSQCRPRMMARKARSSA